MHFLHHIHLQSLLGSVAHAFLEAAVRFVRVVFASCSTEVFEHGVLCFNPLMNAMAALMVALSQL